MGEAGAVAAKGWRGRRRPAQHIVTNVASVPVCVVRLDPHFQRIGEARGFKGDVPGQGGVANDVAQFDRGGVLDPPDNRLRRIRDLGGRVLLHQTPAIDHVIIGRDAGVGQIGDALAEITHAEIVCARLIALFGQGQEAVLHRHRHGASVGNLGAAAIARGVLGVDVLDDHIGVLRIVANVQNAGAVTGQTAHGERVFGAGAAWRVRLDLRKVFAAQKRVDLHQEPVRRVVFTFGFCFDL